MSLLKKFAIAATAALPLLGLVGCGQPTIDLCAPNKAGQTIGDSSYSQIFNGAAEQGKVCIVNGSDLSEGGKYAFGDGLLVVDGDVPAKARIHVDDGKLFVTGDIGADARVEASVPEEISSYTTLIPMFTGKTTIMIPQTHYTFEGFTYENDTDAAVMIGGNVMDKAVVTSNHDVYLGGDQSLSSKFKNSRSEYSSGIYHTGIHDYQVAPVIAEFSAAMR